MGDTMNDPSHQPETDPSVFEEKIRKEATELAKYSSAYDTIRTRGPPKRMVDHRGVNSNLKRLATIKEEMKAFNDDIVAYMQKAEGEEEIEVPVKKQKTVMVEEPLSWKNLWGFLERNQTAKVVEFEERELRKVKRDDYSIDDLKTLIHTSVANVDQFNQELQQYKHSIEQTVNQLVGTRKAYNKDVVLANQAYEKATELIGRFENAIDQYETLVKQYRGTDDRKWELENELVDLEMKLEEVKSDAKISGETSLLKNNYKKVLTTYSRVLNDTKEEARRWAAYLTHFVQGVHDVDITMENVYQVCSYIAESCNVMGETVQHMSFLGSKLGQIYQVVRGGTTPEIRSPVDLDNITREVDARNQEEHQYRQNLSQKMDIQIEPDKRVA